MQPLLVSLLAAAEAAPTDVTLRLHVVELLREHGEIVEAIRHCAAALSVEPTAEPAQALMRDLLTGSGQAGGGQDGQSGQSGGGQARAGESGHSGAAEAQGSQARTIAEAATGPGALQPTASHASTTSSPSIAPAAAAAYGVPAPAGNAAQQGQGEREASNGVGWDGDRDDLGAERVNVTLADIGGMDIAKERLEAAVLAPMRNPELRRLYRQSRTGGVLLYGPPGCGKTFLARATAGELDVRFLSVTFDGMTPEEQVDEIATVFQAARDQAPVVLCLVGIEFLGGPRSRERRGASLRAVNALAAELDKGPEGNLGITVMGTTNAPWEVDPALRRPGRLEQALLVLPPDRTTREVVLHQQLGDHPDVDIPKVARRARGYSGRDLAAAIRTAESRSNGTVTTQDVLDALNEQPPSAQEWLETASRETAVLGDHTSYVGLREYLAARRGDQGGTGGPAPHAGWPGMPGMRTPQFR